MKGFEFIGRFSTKSSGPKIEHFPPQK